MEKIFGGIFAVAITALWLTGTCMEADRQRKFGHIFEALSLPLPPIALAGVLIYFVIRHHDRVKRMVPEIWQGRNGWILGVALLGYFLFAAVGSGYTLSDENKRQDASVPLFFASVANTISASAGVLYLIYLIFDK